MEHTKINNRYEIIEQLGQGGMGVIYRAQDTLLQRPVALKIVGNVELMGSEGPVRLLHEARAAAGLNHPNIVSIYDAGEHQGAPYIVMELVEGDSLLNYHPQNIEEMVEIARQLCAALQHAHTNGIIHRDLKPENVLFTPSGSVKLTDFGLARSVASRLTTDGVIAGTLFYLAPELALGGKFDGSADLYALGVMLYEMVTGRLPFNEKDPVALISQHLHAPVVPPQSIDNQIPTRIDRLILHLLEKDPKDRPGDAAAVLLRLDDYNLPLPDADENSAPSVLNRIARGRMIGREAELEEAIVYWDQALAGQGNVLLISGESGIGKTRFVQELATHAEVSGGKVLMGASYAETNIPYDPFSQIVRNVLEDGTNGTVIPDFVISDLLTLVPDLRLRYPQLPVNPILEPVAQQHRLFENMFTFTSAISETHPVLLVLDDAHWADSASLGLFLHLARRSRDLPVLIVGTYREHELDDSKPFFHTLNQINRERIPIRLKLSRLSFEGTTHLLNALFDGPIPENFAKKVFQETEGNPFFIEEVCKALIEQGDLVYSDGKWIKTKPSALSIPQSVRMVIQSRTRQLAQEHQDILLIGAIIGRKFDFDALLEATGAQDIVLIDALEAAERAQLIEERSSESGGTFIFSHALIPATLRENISGLRRRRLHRQVAIALERLRPTDYESLAYQYVQANALKIAAKYLNKAGDRARSWYANQDAIQFYSEAIELLVEDPEAQFNVLMKKVEMYDLIADRTAQKTDAKTMLALAEEINEKAIHCDSLIVVADSYIESDHTKAMKPARKALKLTHKLEDPIREAHALRRVGFTAWYMHDFEESESMLEDAVRIFTEADLPAEAAACLNTLALTLLELGKSDEALKSTREAVELSKRTKNAIKEATSLRRLAIVYMHLDQYEKALPIAEAALALHRRLGDRSEECFAVNVLAILHANLDHSEQAFDYFMQSIALAKEIEVPLGIFQPITNLIYHHFVPQGDFCGALALLEEEISEAFEFGHEWIHGQFLWLKANLLVMSGQYLRAISLEPLLTTYVKEFSQPMMEIELLSNLAVIYARLGDFEKAYSQIQIVVDMVNAGEFGEKVRDIPQDKLAQITILENTPESIDKGLEIVKLIYEKALEKKHSRKHEMLYAYHLKAVFLIAAKRPEEALENAQLAFEIANSLHKPKTALFYKIAFNYSEALAANNREDEAREYLQIAYEWVMKVANKTQDSSSRRSWLEHINENREIVKAWKNQKRIPA